MTINGRPRHVVGRVLPDPLRQLLPLDRQRTGVIEGHPGAVAGPQLAAASAAADRTGFRRAYREALGLSLLVTVPICLGLLAFASPVLGLFGPGYEEGGATLAVVCIGVLVNVATGPCQLALIMCGRSRTLRNISAVVVPSGLALTGVLSVRFGAVGAAAGTSLALGSLNLAAVILLVVGPRPPQAVGGTASP